MKKIIGFSAVLAGVAPLFAFAVGQTLTGIFAAIGGLLSYIMPILITLAAIWFVWNVIQYLISGEEEKKKKAKGGIISGLIGLIIIIAFWGIIGIFMRSFDIDKGAGMDVVPFVPLSLDGNRVYTDEVTR